MPMRTTGTTIVLKWLLLTSWASSTGNILETCTDLYSSLCSYRNLELAWKKARKRKTLKKYVIDFEANLENNLKQIKYELETFTYSPEPLATFIVRDPKTRRISASHFRDRVVCHALCNVIEPILSNDFIYDSFANQKHKGTHKAILRFESFARRARDLGSCATCFALKADIKHYFDTVNHKILLQIIEWKISDKSIIWLIKRILANHKIGTAGQGMPLGNLTSQFFANVYLNELDHYVKYKLRVKHYIRYVDDFVILHRDKKTLNQYKFEIGNFLKSNLNIELHPEMSRIIRLRDGVTFLGFRVFRKHRLLKKSNVRKIWSRLETLKIKKDTGEINFEDAIRSLNGWLAYAKFANTYKLRNNVYTRFNELFYKSQ